MSFISLIVVIIIAVFVFKRINDLTRRVNLLTEKLETKGRKTATPAVATAPKMVATPSRQVAKPSSPGAFDKFVDWIKTDWLMKIGALFLILALVWFVSYSFMQNWIGPVGRISLGISAGAGFLFWGHKLIERKSAPGQIIVIVGMIAVLFTVFAARDLYNFFTPALALGIMVLTIALVAVIAIVHRTLALALVALIGGAIAPLLTNSLSPDFVVLLSYIFILDLGVLAIVALRGWRSLILLGLIITGIYSVVFYEINLSTAWIFMVLFFGLFFAASISAIWRDRKALFVDLITSILAVILAIFWIAEFVPEHFQSLVAAGAAGVIAVLSALLFRRGAPSGAIYTHGAAAIALLGTATVFELEGESLTIALFLETTALLAVATFGMKDARAVRGTAFLQIAPLTLALPSLNYWRDFGSEFAVILVGIICFTTSTFILKNFFADEKDAFPKVFLILSAVFSVAFIWRILEVLVESRSAAHGAALVIFAIAGIILFFRGNSKTIQTEKIAGMLLLGAVALRLILVEIWLMSLGGKIVTFLLIGILFISTAFFKKNNPSQNA